MGSVSSPAHGGEWDSRPAWPWGQRTGSAAGHAKEISRLVHSRALSLWSSSSHSLSEPQFLIDPNPALTPDSTPPLPPCSCWLCRITLSPPVKSGCPHSAVGMSKPQQSFTTFCVFPSTLHIEPRGAIFLLVTSLSWQTGGHVAAAGSRPHSSLQQPNHGGPLLVLNLLVSAAAPSASQNPPPRSGRSSHT